MTLGSQSFDMDNFTTHTYESVSILYDAYPPSCKIDINYPKFKKTTPTSGGFSLMELDVAITCISSILEEIVDPQLAKEVLGCYSRFMVSNPAQEHILNRRGSK